MEPINLNFSSKPSGPKRNCSSQKNYWRIIILILLLIIYFYNSDDTSYYDVQDNTSPNSNQTNTVSNYSNYEDTSIKNASKDKYTLMVYMCGSNLESDGGYASSDIEEMLKSSLADEVNVLIYTGGASRWYDYGISNRTNQIYKIEKHKLKLVKDNLGIQNMASANTLASFLKYGKENFPAKKYALILWDHGGGAVSGFGLDENSSKTDHLTIDELKSAVDSFGEKLEFVGFDACLMANVETAYALKDGANYFVASEETEPGTGWDYIKLLNGLSKDSSQTGNVTGKTIVDSFIASNSSFRNPDATLSVVDLSKMDNLYSKLVSFMKDIKATNFDKNKYNAFSKNLVNTKAFGEGDIDTIDLLDFAQKMDVSTSDSLVNAVNQAVVYNKTNQYVENANGLSIFIPYENLADYETMLTIYRRIGIESDYTNVLTQYVNAIAGGKKPSYTVNNYSYSQDSYDYSEYSWLDLLFATKNMDMYKETQLDATKLNVEDEGEYYSLKLSKDDWEKITKVESVVWYDTKAGYLDMGTDSYYTQDEDGDLKVEFDGTWLAINGDNICYEVIERTSNYEKGKVPALVNKERVNIILYFDKENPDGIVLGYEPDYEYINQTVYERGLRELKKGDKVDFIARMYSYDGDVQDEYYINETLVVGDDELEVSYESLGDNECLIYYKLTDIYGNIYYTEPVVVY